MAAAWERLDEAGVEQTLFQLREVKAYRIPARPAAGGHRSGEWLVRDELFTGRLRMIARGEAVELRLEDARTGELFALAPFTPATQPVAVEPCADSSRNFVLRVEDPATKRHAFLGLGFAERGAAFDFQAAMADHARHCQRAQLAAAGAAGAALVEAPAGPGAQQAAAELASLWRDPGDLRLKEGQTLHIQVKRPASSSGSGTGGFLARGGGGSSGPGGAPASGARGVLLPPPVLPPPAGQQQQPAQQQAPPPPSAAVVADSEAGWATFD